MNKKREADLQILAKKLYNDNMRHIKTMELNEVETSKVLEYLTAMYRKHFINYQEGQIMGEYIDYFYIAKYGEQMKMKKLPTKHSLVGLQGNTEYTFLTEDGLYEVLIQSRKPLVLLIRTVITTKLNFQLSSWNMKKRFSFFYY